MALDSLIPFGLEEASGELVDVANVPRGLKSGCICPSCKTLLVARQGNKKEWHFAHHSRSDTSGTKKECEYSFFVSVRLMIRQLATQALKIKTPSLVENVEASSDVSLQSKIFRAVVTESALNTLNDAKVGISFSDTEVDVLGSVKDIPFAIYCTYKGRGIPESLKNPNTQKCGILEMDLTEIPKLFSSIQSGHYLEALKKFIEEETASKSWIYHPRYESAMAGIEVQIEKWKSAQTKFSNKASSLSHTFDPSTTTNQPSPISIQIEKHFKCVICKIEWFGASRECKVCKTHLYTTEVIVDQH